MKRGHEVVVATAPPCDFCSERGVDRPAKVDGATTIGPWANMCDGHFALYGRGLGVGVGQRLIVRPVE